jgi:predicted GTPase
MNNSEGLKPFQQSLAGLPQWVSERILQQINQLTRYEPVIGIMGKPVREIQPVQCPVCR